VKDQRAKLVPPGPRPLAEAVAGSSSCTAMRVAKPKGKQVEVETIVSGLDDGGFWVAPSMDGSALAERTLPLWLQVQLATMLEPPPSAGNWWPTAQGAANR
jgi:hypothetical protein